MNAFDNAYDHMRKPHRETREGAEALVYRHSFLRYPFDAAHNHRLAMDGRFDGANARLMAANAETAETRAKVEDLNSRYGWAGQVPPPEELEPLREKLARNMESEVAADAEAKKVGKATSDARFVDNRNVNFLAHCAANNVRVRPVVVKTGRGSPIDLLSSNLARQKDVNAEVTRIKGAGTPVGVIKERLGEQLDALRARDAFHLDYANGSPNWLHPVTALDAEHKLPGRVVATNDLLPLLLWLAGDDIREKLMERVDEDHRGDTRLRMDADEKAKTLRKLRSNLLDLQREEAALRILLAGSSREIAFPREMPVEVVLGVETY